MNNATIIKLIAALFFVVMLTCASKATCQSIPVYLNMRQLCCDHTTELGADEVYITVEGTKSDGVHYKGTRYPGNNQHWDMNDGNQGTNNPYGDSHCITDVGLLSTTLAPGESFSLVIIINEEDGGNTARYQEAAESLLASTENPYAMTVAGVLELMNHYGVNFTDTDDWMGMIGLKITNVNGEIVTSWNPIGGIVHCMQDPSYPGDANRREIRMDHDGSNYVGWFSVTYNKPAPQPQPTQPVEHKERLHDGADRF